MSDFDDALERLVVDPAFRTALATDPVAALAGYRLSPDELELLNAQVDTGVDAGGRHVEQRTSKASMFGLLAPMAGGGGTGPGFADALQGGESEPPGPGAHTSAAPVYGQSGQGHAEMGRADAGHAEMGSAGAGHAEMGRAGTPYTPATPYTPPTPSAGTPYTPVAAGEDDPGVASLQSVEYHTRVDADGDGRWDRFTVVDRDDQGVDLVVDRDNDGRAEFVGHDLDRDGLIDAATTDTDRDGQLDTHWVDDNVDGWLDRRAAMPIEEVRGGAPGVAPGGVIEPAEAPESGRGRNRAE